LDKLDLTEFSKELILNPSSPTVVQRRAMMDEYLAYVIQVVDTNEKILANLDRFALDLTRLKRPEELQYIQSFLNLSAIVESHSGGGR
jgi:hypothetical protein